MHEKRPQLRGLFLFLQASDKLVQLTFRRIVGEHLVQQVVFVWIYAITIGKLGKLQLVVLEGEQFADVSDLSRCHRVAADDLLGDGQLRAIERLLGDELVCLVIIMRVHAINHRWHRWFNDGRLGLLDNQVLGQFRPDMGLCRFQSKESAILDNAQGLRLAEVDKLPHATLLLVVELNADVITVVYQVLDADGARWLFVLQHVIDIKPESIVKVAR